MGGWCRDLSVATAMVRNGCYLHYIIRVRYGCVCTLSLTKVVHQRLVLMLSEWGHELASNQPLADACKLYQGYYNNR